MWTVVYVAHGENDAEKIKELLIVEGFLVKTRKVGNNDNSIEILVPGMEASEAQDTIYNR